MVKLLITGSRNADKRMLEYACKVMDRVKELGWSIIVGDAEGIDKQVLYKCCWLGVPFTFYGITNTPRHYCCGEHLDFYYRIGGDYLARDRAMVLLADRVLAIWDGKSRGTKYTYDYAVRLGKTVNMFNAAPGGARDGRTMDNQFNREDNEVETSDEYQDVFDEEERAYQEAHEEIAKQMRALYPTYPIIEYGGDDETDDEAAQRAVAKMEAERE